MLESVQTIRRAAIAAVLAGLACVAGAQQVYRIVGPDGKVTFSDKPPAESGGRTVPAPSVAMPGGAATGSLPFELRQVANRFPVTLYTGPDCAPCGSGRALLASRGIPYTEKSVTSNADVDALKRLTGGTNLPLLTIGGQQLTGYSATEWGQFLDAAGYPQTSQLPSGYRQAAATPLVDAQAAPRTVAPSKPVTPATAAAPAPAPAPSGSNPAGIQF